MGRPLGAAGDRERHRRVVAAALDVIDAAEHGGSIVELTEAFRPGRRHGG